MVTRLRSDKGSFVRSPKGAFDTEDAPLLNLQVEYAIFQASVTQPNQYFSLDTGACARGNSATQYFNGPGLDWRFTFNELDQQAWDPNLIKSMVLSQAPSVQTIDIGALIDAGTTCVEGSGFENHWAPPTVPGSGSFELHDIQMFGPSPFAGNYWFNFAVYNHPNTGLAQAYFPTDWSPGLLQWQIGP